jgi:LacI family transcriptional regulator
VTDDASSWAATATAAPVSPRVRLRDVASAAGVSVSTASRVLCGNPSVSPAARRAVLGASRRLNYHRDPIARAMRTQHTGTVGMLVPDIANPFFAELIEAVARALEAVDVDLLLADSHGSVASEARWLVSLGERRVDGLLVVPVHHHDSRAALRAAQATAPLVQLDRRVDDVAADFVGVDNTLGLGLVIDHLAAQGVARVALISGADTSSTGRGRMAALAATLDERRSIDVVARLLGEFSIGFGREAVRTLAADGPMPPAIVCGSDIIALGALTELKRLGHRVPDDVLVTGFDGILMSELTEPALTTVGQPVHAIAREAQRLLSLRIEGSDEPPQCSEIAPGLIVRASSERPAP